MDISFIIYVQDQEFSKNFYSEILDLKPTLDVPGMTEFKVASNVTLGIMPESGIKRILGAKADELKNSKAPLKAEIYLRHKNAKKIFELALERGAKKISDFEKRNWGEEVAYLLDKDGNIIGLSKI